MNRISPDSPQVAGRFQCSNVRKYAGYCVETLPGCENTLVICRDEFGKKFKAPCVQRQCVWVAAPTTTTTTTSTTTATTLPTTTLPTTTLPTTSVTSEIESGVNDALYAISAILTVCFVAMFLRMVYMKLRERFPIGFAVFEDNFKRHFFPENGFNLTNSLPASLANWIREGMTQGTIPGHLIRSLVWTVSGVRFGVIFFAKTVLFIAKILICSLPVVISCCAPLWVNICRCFGLGYPAPAPTGPSEVVIDPRNSQEQGNRGFVPWNQGQDEQQPSTSRGRGQDEQQPSTSRGRRTRESEEILADMSPEERVLLADRASRLQRVLTTHYEIEETLREERKKSGTCGIVDEVCSDSDSDQPSGKSMKSAELAQEKRKDTKRKGKKSSGNSSGYSSAFAPSAPPEYLGTNPENVWANSRNLGCSRVTLQSSPELSGSGGSFASVLEPKSHHSSEESALHCRKSSRNRKQTKFYVSHSS